MNCMQVMLLFCSENFEQDVQHVCVRIKAVIYIGTGYNKLLNLPAHGAYNLVTSNKHL